MYYQLTKAQSKPVIDDQVNLGVSLVISSYMRMDNVKRVLNSYVSYDIFSEIIIWHNGPSKFDWDLGKSDKVKLIQSHDLGLASRFAAGLLARNNLVCFQDDDILIEESNWKRLIDAKEQNPNSTICVEGKIPYKDGTYGRAIKPKPGKVMHCEIHLNRAFCTNQVHLGYFFPFWQRTQLSLSPEVGGGEDIVYSYAVSSKTKESPIAIGIEFENLESDHAISNRSGNQHHNRTSIMKICKEIVLVSD